MSQPCPQFHVVNSRKVRLIRFENGKLWPKRLSLSFSDGATRDWNWVCQPVLLVRLCYGISLNGRTVLAIVLDMRSWHHRLDASWMNPNLGLRRKRVELISLFLFIKLPGFFSLFRICLARWACVMNCRVICFNNTTHCLIACNDWRCCACACAFVMCNLFIGRCWPNQLLIDHRTLTIVWWLWRFQEIRFEVNSVRNLNQKTSKANGRDESHQSINQVPLWRQAVLMESIPEKRLVD